MGGGRSAHEPWRLCLFGTGWAITAVAALTFASGGIVLARMRETAPAVLADRGPV
jgi:hypothetical protein